MINILFPNNLVIALGIVVLIGIYLCMMVISSLILAFAAWYLICLCRVLYYMPRCIRWFTKPFWGPKTWQWVPMFCWFAWHLANLNMVTFNGYGFTVRVDRGRLIVTRAARVGKFIPASRLST